MIRIVVMLLLTLVLSSCSTVSKSKEVLPLKEIIECPILTCPTIECPVVQCNNTSDVAEISLIFILIAIVFCIAYFGFKK